MPTREDLIAYRKELQKAQKEAAKTVREAATMNALEATAYWKGVVHAYGRAITILNNTNP